ncbi:MAG TPA: ABC transporter substrate-binding protein [Solirubrobacteraceae bacterium]|jgi:NitT/TauT family transport system substrate-binding protein/putative hydroxymethylpyrimidine transport system substrate-binding protein|nr:ABC transporter substrate-binding protein [Solirubrobacteraceae bacterium]
MRSILTRILAAALAAALIAACGSSGPSTAQRQATLILDFVPNAVHAGIYRALAAGYYSRDGVKLSVEPPGSTSTAIQLVEAGKAQFGLADGIDVAEQVAAGKGIEAVMAIVQRPLGAPIALASERLRSPADLQGKLVGITGVPSDRAALDTVVADAGGDPAKVRVVTVGFDGVAYLEAGKIAAFTGYWPDDGVSLQVSGHPITVFKLDRYGGPAYPGLVAFTSRALIRRDPGLVRAFVKATVRGYEDTLRDGARSLDDLLARNPSIKRRLAKASLAAYEPVFDTGGVPDGTLVPARIAALSSWLLKNHLIPHAVSPSAFGTNAFLP